MIEKKTDTIEVAAAKAGFSRVTGYRLAVDSHGDPTLGQQEGFVLFVRSVLFFLWLFVRRHGIRCCDESCTGIFPDDARGF